MSAALAIKSWMENVLEKPFLEAEMARAEIMKARPGEENMVAVVWLTIYAAGYLASCTYWAAKYLF